MGIINLILMALALALLVELLMIATYFITELFSTEAHYWLERRERHRKGKRS